MSKISNRFFVTAIEDGTTLHGTLNSTIPLSQGWDGSAAVPNWTSNHPKVYLNLLSGNTAVNPTTVTWKYNYDELLFDSSGLSTNIRYPGWFKKITYNGKQALEIMVNLATDDNVDLDVITVEGTFATGGTSIGFAASVNVRISKIGANSYLGLIDYEGGVNTYTESGQRIKLCGRLFSGGGGEVQPSSFVPELYINDVQFSTALFPNSNTGSVVDSSGVTRNGWWIDERDITGNAIIRIDFKVNCVVEYQAYDTIDDMQDQEELYIQYNSENGQSATLRSGEEVEFYFWVGKTDDPTPIDSYNSYKIQLLDAAGNVVMSHIEGFYDPDENGWRNMYVDTFGPSTPVYHSGRRAHCVVKYSVVQSLGKNMQGIVLAQQTS